MRKLKLGLVEPGLVDGPVLPFFNRFIVNILLSYIDCCRCPGAGTLAVVASKNT